MWHRGLLLLSALVFQILAKERASRHQPVFLPNSGREVENFETLYHQDKIVYRDVRARKCYVIPSVNDLRPSLLYMTSGILPKTQMRKLGDVPEEFCKSFKTMMAVAVPFNPNKKKVAKLKNFRHRRNANGNNFPYKSNGRGKYRGQTQSQYLNVGLNGSNPGRAEAESSRDGSRAVVTGTSGMGQAQSQSFGSGCEDCYDRTQNQGISYNGGGRQRYPTATYPGQSLDHGSLDTHGSNLQPGTVGGSGGVPDQLVDRQKPVRPGSYPSGVPPSGQWDKSQGAGGGLDSQATRPRGPGETQYPSVAQPKDPQYPGFPQGPLQSHGKDYRTPHQIDQKTRQPGSRYPDGTYPPYPAGPSTQNGQTLPAGQTPFPRGPTPGQTQYPGQTGQTQHYPRGPALPQPSYPAGQFDQHGQTLPPGQTQYPAGPSNQHGQTLPQSQTRYPVGPSNQHGQTLPPGQSQYPAGPSNQHGQTLPPGQTQYPAGPSNQYGQTLPSGQTQYPAGPSNQHGQTLPSGQTQYPAGPSNQHGQTLPLGQSQYPAGPSNQHGQTLPPGQTQYPAGPSNQYGQTLPPGQNQYPFNQHGQTPPLSQTQYPARPPSQHGQPPPPGPTAYPIESGGQTQYPAGPYNQHGQTLPPGQTQYPAGPINQFGQITHTGKFLTQYPAGQNQNRGTNQYDQTQYPSGPPNLYRQTVPAKYPGPSNQYDQTQYPGHLNQYGLTTQTGLTHYPAGPPNQFGQGQNQYPQQNQQTPTPQTQYPSSPQQQGQTPPTGQHYPQGHTDGQQPISTHTDQTNQGYYPSPGYPTQSQQHPYAPNQQIGSGVQPYPVVREDQTPQSTYPVGPGGIPSYPNAQTGLTDGQTQTGYPKQQTDHAGYPSWQTNNQQNGQVDNVHRQPYPSVQNGQTTGGGQYPFQTGQTQTPGQVPYTPDQTHRLPTPGQQYPHGQYPTDNGQYTGDVIKPSTLLPTEQVIMPGVHTLPGQVNGGTSDQTPSAQYDPRTPPGQQPSQWPVNAHGGYPQAHTQGHSLQPGADGKQGFYDEDGSSQAETSIQQIRNETQASAMSNGRLSNGLAQTQISGTYSGSGSFSAQAQTSDSNKGAQSQISVGKMGAISSAQGNAGYGQSQAQLQLESESGGTTAEAQSGGWNHGTNTQVQASSKGGMADAQANGPGSTSSQAQIGFQPYQEATENENQNAPFYGGGMASAQSGKYAGQSQTQIQGKFKYGISYNGAAQAGSGSKDNSSRNKTTFKPLDLVSGHNLRPDREVNIHPKDNKNEKQAVSRQDNESMQEAESKRSPQTHSDYSSLNEKRNFSKIQTLPAEPKQTFKTDNEDFDDKLTRDTQTLYDNYDNDDAEDDDEMEDDTEFYAGNEPNAQNLQYPRKHKDVVVQQAGKTQKQHIILGPLTNNGAHVIQDTSSNVLKEGMIFQPGEVIPGTQGYTIPIGFRGRVSSVSHGNDTFSYSDDNGESQAQTVNLTPGSRNITYTKSPRKTAPSLRSWTPNYHNEREGNNNNHRVSSYNLRNNYYNPDSYVTVTKSETGQLNTNKNNPEDNKKYSHTYYTKSSTCGYFTFSCNIVYGSNGQTKVCKEKARSNPDGTPVQC